MNVAWKPEPSLFHFTAGVLYATDRHWLVHHTYARLLFAEAKALRDDEPSERMKLPAARWAVRICRADAERGWASKGYPVDWTDDDYDRIASEIVGTLTNHPKVVEAVEAIIEVFSDVALTHGDELFVVGKAELDEQVLIETPIVTIKRSLNYLDDLLKSKSDRPYIRLRQNLTILARVHDVVVAH
jgi:hypothetical protein